MNRLKRVLSTIIIVAMLCTMAVPAYAAVQDTGFSDVNADAWYAKAVAYVQGNNLLDGVSESEFAPNTPASRITLAVALYRAENKPAVSGTAVFSDVPADTENGAAVAWASANGIVSGYGNGIFGADDPITREQIAAIFWRWAGQPERNGDAEVFSDQNSISEWAVDAVVWARSNDVISGKPNNLFDPKGTATRAEVATLLMNYLTRQTETPESEPQPISKALIVYFSMPETTNPDNMTQDEDNSVVVIDGKVLGNTEYVANLIQENTGADVFRVEPKTPYPTDHATLVDLAQKELNDNTRPEIAAVVENIEQYDVIFFGYPIWWGDFPMILYTFLEEYDLSGKTIVPFNTHGGSGLANTVQTLTNLEPNATVKRNAFSVSRNTVANCENDVIAWLKSLSFIE